MHMREKVKKDKRRKKNKKLTLYALNAEICDYVH